MIKRMLMAILVIVFSTTNLSSVGAENNDDDLSKLREEALYLYEHGDIEQAFNLLISSKLSREPDIQFQISQMYEQGEGTEKNDKEALSWLIMSISQNHFQAISYMINVYKFGLLGFEKDPKKEKYWQDLSLKIADQK